MTPEQFKNNLRKVFSDLSDSGFDINADIYRCLMSLYADYKTVRSIADASIEKSVALFNELRIQRAEVIRLNKELAELKLKLAELKLKYALLKYAL